MEVLIISDTHGREANLEIILNQMPEPDCLIHLGDSEGGEDRIRNMVSCPVYMVAGNCDYFCQLPNAAVLTLCGHRILITHGHYFYVSMGTDELVRAAKENQCEIAIYGHTHKPLLKQKDPDVLVLNPGSLSLPRQEGHLPSYMMMTLEEGERPEIELCFLE